MACRPLRRVSRLAALCLGYVGIFAAAATGGAAVAAWQGHALVISGRPHPAADTAFLTQVLDANGRVWVYICTGLASFGVVGGVVLFGNAFRFGMDVTSIARGTPHELVYLLPHASLEFAAFILAGASCQYLAWWVFDLLVLHQVRVAVRPGLRTLALSLVLLVVAAYVETCSYSARVG
jgi:uncharacterized membrane protein SpoIIM required for sporulation